MSENVKGRKSPAKIVGIIFGCIAGLALLVVAGFFLYIQVRYAPFYNQARAEFEIPGTYDGFVAQGLGYV